MFRGKGAARPHPDTETVGLARDEFQALRLLNNTVFVREDGVKVLSVRPYAGGWVPSLLWHLETGEVERV